MRSFASALAAFIGLWLTAGAAISQNEQSTSDDAARRDYLAVLSKSIDRVKVDPRSKQAGTVVVRITVGSDGKLLSRTVEKSSGSKVLDAAAVATVDHAAPFPPMPQTLAQGPIEVSVPFDYATQ